MPLSALAAAILGRRPEKGRREGRKAAPARGKVCRRCKRALTRGEKVLAVLSRRRECCRCRGLAERL